ncbi:MAG: hypothetical protein E7582_03160 [Ruminococcaceae bacterium]|nr:hypothetical protein [Oscillospiraceae bacterium]
MASNAKNYAKQVLEGYESTLSNLAQKYINTRMRIDSEHNEKNKTIEKEAWKKKKAVSAANKIELENTKSNLLEKGLSKSGESVQAELDSNLIKNNAFSQIESDKEMAKAENEKSRESAKLLAYQDYMDDANDIKIKRNEEYIKQLNADREYEAERNDEEYKRLIEQRDFDAARDDEKFDRYTENRDYQLKYNQYLSDLASKNKEEEEEKGIDPDISPKVLVDKINSVFSTKYYKEPTKKTEYIKKAIEDIVEDSTLLYSYRYQVQLYAKALGLY